MLKNVDFFKHICKFVIVLEVLKSIITWYIRTHIGELVIIYIKIEAVKGNQAKNYKQSIKNYKPNLNYLVLSHPYNVVIL